MEPEQSSRSELQWNKFLDPLEFEYKKNEEDITESVQLYLHDTGFAKLEGGALAFSVAAGIKLPKKQEDGYSASRKFANDVQALLSTQGFKLAADRVVSNGTANLDERVRCKSIFLMCNAQGLQPEQAAFFDPKKGLELTSAEIIEDKASCVVTDLGTGERYTVNVQHLRGDITDTYAIIMGYKPPFGCASSIAMLCAWELHSDKGHFDPTHSTIYVPHEKDTYTATVTLPKAISK